MLVLYTLYIYCLPSVPISDGDELDVTLPVICMFYGVTDESGFRDGYAVTQPTQKQDELAY